MMVRPGSALVKAQRKPKRFIQSAIKHPGSLHRALGVPEGQKIPESKIESAAAAGGELAKKARFAQELAGLRRK